MRRYILSIALLQCLMTTAIFAQDPAIDDFNRSMLGPDWNILFGGTSVGIVGGSDIGLVAGSARFGLVEWHHNNIGADQFSSAVISATRHDSMLTQVFVRRRASDAARYGFHWDDRNGGEWQIKYDGVPTAETRILAAKGGDEPQPGDTLRIEIRGRSIRGLHNGVEILSAIDSDANAITEAGRPGMAFRFTIDVPAMWPAAAFDFWSGGSLEEKTPGSDSVMIVVDNTRSHQVMEGFGATTLSLVYGTVDNVSPALRAQAIEAVYGQVKLTMGQLEPGLMETPANASDLWNQRRNDNDDPFSINPDGFNWLGQEAMRRKVVDLAAPYGFNDYSLANKITTKGALSFLDPFRTQDYDRYLDECAEHIVAGMIHWRDVYGITPPWVSPWNEPTSGNGEIAGGTTQILVDLVKRIGKRLKDEGFGVGRLIVPGEETVQRSYDVAKAILSDPEAREYVGAIAYHAYPYESPYSSVRQILEQSGRGMPVADQIAIRNRLRDLGAEYNVPLWLNEISEGPGNNDYAFGAFENVRARAIHIHDELLYANASAYYGMLAMWDRKSHEDHFAGRGVDFFSEASSIALIDTDRVYISGMGYAIGHYARWIRRGAVRIDAISSDSLVQATAFRDEATRRLVMVLINNRSTDQTITVRTVGTHVQKEVIGEQSTAAAQWETIAGFNAINDSTIRLTLPPRSVTTIAASLNGISSGIASPSQNRSVQWTGVTPNPIRDQGRVRFQLPEESRVHLAVQDVMGHTVAILVDDILPSGDHAATLEGTALPGGTYLVVLRTPSAIITKKVIVVR